MTLGARLKDGLDALGATADEAVCERLLAYLRLLEKWNRVYNLTAVRGPEAMLTQHVLDSAAVVPHLVGTTVLDVGSGAGLPGIPIALLCPHRRVTLLDSNHKKTTFLQQVAIELALTNVNVVCERVESWQPRQRFDVVISRAFAELSHFVAAAAHLCAADGMLYAMKGVYPHEELAHLPAGCLVTDVHTLRVPGAAAERHLVLMRPNPVAIGST